MSHAFNWVEIPSIDFDRAVDFYSTVLNEELDVYEPESDDAPNGRWGMFPAEEGAVGGMIVETDEYTPDSGETIPYAPVDDSGLVVYLSVDGDLDDVLARVESAGGEVLVPPEPIPDTGGHYALITDSETNRIGLMAAE